MIEVPKLEPRHLFERRQRRDAARLRAYNTLLQQIYHKIYACSLLPGHSPDILFTVPPFILGLPKLDMEDCIVYLVHQLRDSKFEVRFTYPNILFISWKHHETDYFRNENPIVRAMMPEPTPEPVQTRKTGGAREGRGTASLRASVGARTGAPDVTRPTVRFSEPLSASTREAAGFSLPSVAPPPLPGPAPQKRATDYTPPATFIQQLERPGPQRERPSGNSAIGGLTDLWNF